MPSVSEPKPFVYVTCALPLCYKRALNPGNVIIVWEELYDSAETFKILLYNFQV